MTTTLVPPDYLNISGNITTTSIAPLTSEQITALGNVTISNATGSNYYYTGAGIGSGSTFTITTAGAVSGSIGIGGAGSSAGPFTWKQPEEFVDTMPNLDRIQKMCEEYPGLKIAYEKFVTTYKLVKDHYDTPEDQRPLP